MNDDLTDLCAKLELLAEVSCDGKPDYRSAAHIASEAAAVIRRLSAESALKNEVVRAAQNLMRQPRRNSNPRYGAAWERLDAALNAVSNLQTEHNPRKDGA